MGQRKGEVQIMYYRPAFIKRVQDRRLTILAYRELWECTRNLIHLKGGFESNHYRIESLTTVERTHVFTRFESNYYRIESQPWRE